MPATVVTATVQLSNHKSRVIVTKSVMVLMIIKEKSHLKLAHNEGKTSLLVRHIINVLMRLCLQAAFIHSFVEIDKVIHSVTDTNMMRCLYLMI